MSLKNNDATFLVIMIALAILVPLVAGVLLLEIWIGVHIVQLVLAGSFKAAYVWALLGSCVLLLLGGFQAFGNNK